MYRLTIKSGPTATAKDFTISPGQELTIGRAETAQIRLSSGGVSKNHCLLRCSKSGELTIEDLGSSNGTRVNGVVVKKKLLTVGDTIGVHKFEIKVKPPLSPKKPLTLSEPNFGSSSPASHEGGYPQTSYGNLALKTEHLNWANSSPSTEVRGQESSIPQVEKNLNEKLEAWAEKSLFPLADSLTEKLSIRSLIFISFVVWSFILLFAGIMPFSETANQRVQLKSLEVGKLYARQLVRLNQQAVIDQNYKDLIVQLDAKAGQTPGLIDALILDPQKGQVLAPAEKLGAGLPNNFAAKALSMEKEWQAFGPEGIAFVSAPIFVGTPEGNKVGAVAFVTLDTERDIFTFANLLDQILNSLLLSLVFGILIFAFQYRWIEGPLNKITKRLSEFLNGTNSDTTLASPVVWQPLQDLTSEASILMQRASRASNSDSGFSTDGLVGGGSEEGAWANRVVASLPTIPAACFSEDLKVISWNNSMEKLTGVRATQAVGSDLAQASRDLAFETAIRDLTQAASSGMWSEQTKDLEFSGTPYQIKVIYGPKSFLIIISPKEEGT